MPDRAIVFVDGNNVYHGLTRAGLRGPASLSFKKVAEKLIAPGDQLAQIRYYVGQVENKGGTRLYDEQQKFVSRQKREDSRISFHFGRLEPRPVDNVLASAIVQFIERKDTVMRYEYINQIRRLCEQYQLLPYFVEKAVDVQLAVDVVTMAVANQYEVAYILSADGDYTPAIKFVQSQGKTVRARSVSPALQLRAAVGAANHQNLEPAWFRDCYV